MIDTSPAALLALANAPQESYWEDCDYADHANCMREALCAVAAEKEKLEAINAELLEALESAVRMIDDLNSAYGADSVRAVSNAGRAAIAKATGETS